MRPLRGFLAHRSGPFLLALAIALVVAVGLADFLAGYHLSLGLFYVAPIALAAWYVSRPAGLILAVVSALAWFAVNSAFAPLEVTDATLIWNTAVRAGLFIIIASLLASLKEAHRRQIELARTDPLTGLLNSRAFLHEATLELQRARRSRYLIAALYLDLDNFKALNDARGHSAGDSLLVHVAAVLQNELRSTDIIGRVGGDEFAAILSAINPAETEATARRLQAEVNLVSSRNMPPVTVTIGAVISDGSASAVNLLNRADAAMYRGKVALKGSIYVNGIQGDA